MSTQGKEFIERDDVRRALDELFDECVAEYEGSGESRNHDVRGFLQGRGFEPPADSPLKLRQEVKGTSEGEANSAEVIVDPGTGKWCYERCVWTKDGGQICHMVCA